MNLLDIIKTANHNLFRSKLRTFLTILAIFVGSFTIILNSAINAGVNNFIDKQIESIGGEGYLQVAPTETYDNLEELFSSNPNAVKEYNPDKTQKLIASITQADLEKIKAIDGVENAELYTSISPEYITSSKTSKKYQVSINNVPSSTIKIDTVAGTSLNVNSKDPEIVLTEAYVTALGFSSNEAAIGETISIYLYPSICSQGSSSSLIPQALSSNIVSTLPNCTEPKSASAKVVGVEAPGVIMSRGQLNINPAFYHNLLAIANQDLPKTQTEQSFSATVTIDPSRQAEIKEKLKSIGYTATSIADEVGSIRSFFDIILTVFNIFGAIALLAAAIGIVNTLFMSVQERTREIGLDKALGMSSAKVFLSFSVEAILLGFWGSVFGMLVSMLIGYAANSALHLPGSLLADFPTFDLVSFTPATVLPIILVIMLIAFISGTAPARAAAKKDPIDALRYE